MKSIFLYSTLPIVGGNSTQTLELVKFFSNHGYKVSVIARNQVVHGLNSKVMGEIQKMGGSIIVLSDNKIAAFTKLIRCLFSIWATKGEKVFISIGMGNLAPFIALFGNFNLKFFYLITHDLELRPLKKLGFTIYLFDKILVVSPASLTLFKKIISSTLPCVWLPQFSELDISTNIENKVLKLHTRFAFIGSLKESKGILELLKWWGLRKDDAELYILGGGELENVVKDIASKDSRIHYKGSFSAEERGNILPRFFSTIDYLVAPSIGHHEGLPTVILEALSFGVPVVATPGGGTIAFSQNLLAKDFIDYVKLAEIEGIPQILQELKPVEEEIRKDIITKYKKWFSNRAVADAWIKVLN